MHRRGCETAEVILSLLSHKQRPLLTDNGAQAVDGVRELIGRIRAEHEAARRRRVTPYPMESADQTVQLPATHVLRS